MIRRFKCPRCTLTTRAEGVRERYCVKCGVWTDCLESEERWESSRASEEDCIANAQRSGARDGIADSGWSRTTGSSVSRPEVLFDTGEVAISPMLQCTLSALLTRGHGGN